MFKKILHCLFPFIPTKPKYMSKEDNSKWVEDIIEDNINKLSKTEEKSI